MEKISVIVCVYNTKKFVKKCVDCLLKQSYKNMELILIDDGSSDGSGAYLDSIKASNVKVIHNDKNYGLAYSRNVGLDNCSGSYVGFIDSDDYVESDFYEKLMASIISEKSEVSICDMRLYYEYDGTYKDVLGLDGDMSLLNLINNGLVSSCCNKLFKKSLLSKFACGKVNEDIAVVIPALVKAKKISYVPGVFYYYVQRSGSIQNSDFSEKRFDIFDGVKGAFLKIKDHPLANDILDILVYQQLLLLYVYVICNIPSFSKRLRIIRKYGKKILDYDIKNNKYLKTFLSNEHGKSKVYYRLLFFTLEKRLYFINSVLIFSMQLYKKCFKRSVIKEVNDDILVKLAKRQFGKKQDVSVSAVIPNYNYARFLKERVYSILSQDAKINELIILDDCSSDDSLKVINDLKALLSPYLSVKCVFNKKNSGSPFKQWQKGFDLASGDYVWICEADDYCDKRLVGALLSLIKDVLDVRICYCDTAFIDKNGKVILPSIKPEIDILKTGHWDNSYVNSGLSEYNEYSFLNNTIANVSSCLFKKDDYDKFFDISSEYRQAGDWLFYVNVMCQGNIVYCNRTLNYYRVHGNNVSSVMKKSKHLEEIKSIHNYFEKTYGLDEKQKKLIEERYEFLKKVWHL